jgi:uncharacterized protein (TIGR00369 family)
VNAESLNTIAARILRNAAASALGLELVELGASGVTLRLPWKEALLGDPETGALAGGAVTTIIDNAAGMSVAVVLGAGTKLATLDLRVDYLRPSRRGEPLLVRGDCYRTTRHVAFVRIDVWHELPERLVVATGAGTFSVQ